MVFIAVAEVYHRVHSYLLRLLKVSDGYLSEGVLGIKPKSPGSSLKLLLGEDGAKDSVGMRLVSIRSGEE